MTARVARLSTIRQSPMLPVRQHALRRTVAAVRNSYQRCNPCLRTFQTCAASDSNPSDAAKEKERSVRPPSYRDPNTLLDAGAVRLASLRINAWDPAHLKAHASAPTTSADTAVKTVGRTPVIVMHGLLGSGSNWRVVTGRLGEALEARDKSRLLTSVDIDTASKKSGEEGEHEVDPAVPQKQKLGFSPGGKRQFHLLDLRNHGSSPSTPVGTHTYPLMALDVLQYLHENNLSKVSLIGHSMGGRLAMLFALHYPQLVDTLVVVDTAPVSYATSDTFKAYLNMMEALTPEQRGNRTDAENALKHAGIPDRAVRQFLLTNLVRPDGDSAAEKPLEWRTPFPTLLMGLDHIRKFVVQADKRFMGPTIFVGGDKSDYILPEYHQIAKALFPRAEIEMIPDAGHWVHFEKTPEFVEIVGEFMHRHGG